MASKPTAPRAGGFWRWLFATGLDDSGLPTPVANPPVTTPTSALTRPISIVSAVDFYRAGVVSRDVLLSIPSFRRANTLLSGITGSLPYNQFKDGVRIQNAFLDQPESGEGLVRSTTWTKVAEDLLMDGQSLLLVTDFYADGYPRAAKHIPFERWSQDPDTGTVTYDGRKLDADEVRLFSTAFRGLTQDAYPTVLMLNKLRALSAHYADHPQAREHFTSTDGAEPDEEDLAAFLQRWSDARQRGVTAFVPTGLQLESVDQMTPEQLTMQAAKEWEVAEVSRLCGIDPNWLALNIVSKTYANIIDERRNLLDFQCGWMIQAIEQRLSLGDTTPAGSVVRANLDVFLRTSTTERFAAYEVALRAGFMTVNEIRALESRPPLPTEELRSPPAGTTIEPPGDPNA